MAERDLAASLLPDSHFEERHCIRGIDAPLETLRATILGFDDHSDAWLNALLWLRELPARLVYRWRPDLGLAPSQPRFGLASFTRLVDDHTGVAFGLAGCFWRLNFGLQPFTPDNPPGIAKLVLSFQWQRNAAGHHDLTTVTRIYCTDDRARRRMALYWAVIRPFSGLIRLRLLNHIRRASQAPH